MKKLFLFIFVLASLSMSSQSTCAGAAPFCAGGASGITFPASTGNGNAPAGPNYSCLATTPNPAWYYLQINNPGTLDVLIQGQQGGSAGQDVDFICWGPFSSLSGICNSLTAANVVDCSYSGSYTETLNIPNGVTGQYYMVLITNFANVPQDIVFNQQGGTGNTNCSILQANNANICAGSSATIVASNSANLGSPTYSMNPGGQTSTNGTFVVSPLTSVVYTLYVTGINSANAVVTQTTTSTVSVNPQPAAAPTTTQTSCTNTLNAVNLHLSFTPTTPVPNYTLTWSSIPQNFTTSTQQVVTNLGALPYDVTVTAAGGCSVVTHFTMTPAPASANFTILPFGSNYTVTCAQPTVILDASNSSFTYTWSNGSATPVVDTQAGFTSQSLGTWTVTGTNPVSGCTSTHTISISQNTTAPTMAITPTLQNITCASTASTVTLSATSPTINITHYIIGPSGNISSASNPTAIYVPGGPGDYRDSLVIGSTGCSTVRHFSVSSNDVFPGLTVTSPQQFTLGCGTRSVATINLTSTNTNGTIKYNLSFPSATTVPTTFNSISLYTTAVPGTYTAYAQDPVNSCVTPVPFSIIANNFGPDIHATVPLDFLSCFTPTMQLTAVTANTLVSFQWSYKNNGNGNVLSVANPTVLASTNTNVTSPIANTFTLTITDLTNECISTMTVPVLQNQYPPKAGIVAANGSPTPAISCSAPNIQLNSNSFTSIPPNSGFPTNQNIVAMLWEGPSPQTPGTFTSNYQAYVAGPYTLTVRDMNNGCTSFTTLTVIDNRIYPIFRPMTQTTLDCGAPTSVTAAITTTIQGGYQYQWTPPNNVETPGVVYTKSVIPVQDAGIYRVVVRNPINGCATSSAITVVNGSLTSGFVTSGDHGYAPFTVSFSNSSSSNASTNSSLTINTVWTFGNGTQTVTTAPNISPSTTYNQPGTYIVTIFANKGDCRSSFSDTIFVDIPSKLEIPNVFTPNGDGVNDLFFLKVSNLTDITAKIYDRWGRLVYELESTTGNISWDGKNSKGVEASAGTYFYIIKATGKDGQSYDTKGTVTLLR